MNVFQDGLRIGIIACTPIRNICHRTACGFYLLRDSRRYTSTTWLTASAHKRIIYVRVCISFRNDPVVEALPANAVLVVGPCPQLLHFPGTGSFPPSPPHLQPQHVYETYQLFARVCALLGSPRESGSLINLCSNPSLISMCRSC